MTPVFDVDDE